jgi:peptidoglycan hydrolase-like protein with peptidoglycan-binding domain
MRTIGVSQAFSIATALALASCAIYFYEPITRADQQTDATDRRLRETAIVPTGAKDNRSLQTSGDPPPEITTVVVSSRVYPAKWSAEALIASSSQLVRQLQNELKRLGCYRDEINGEWNPATRQAMKDFLERANAVLPLGAPETAHLALLKSRAEPLCGTACPVGQTLARGNQCLPNPLLAIATRQASIAKTTLASEAPLVEAAPVPPAAAQVPRAKRARFTQPGSGFFGLFGF